MPWGGTISGLFYGLRFSGAGAFYSGDPTINNRDWTSPQNDALWRDDMKTLFDPCPSGWRVPQSGAGERSPWSGFTEENGPEEGSGITSGRHFSLPSGTVWYGASGCRNYGSATLTQSVGNIFIWSSCKVSLTGGSIYIFQCTGSVQPSNVGSNYSTYGFPVRCVRR